MLVIGIESSAHTFGVGIVKDGEIIANEKRTYDVGSGGMIPAKVAEFHIENANEIIGRAIKKAGIEINEIEGVGYTKGPGLGPCLQVGELAAKTIAERLDIDIVPVNHGVAHVEIAKHYAKLKDPVALYVSGGNSQILKIEENPFKHYRVLGETLDIGIGNMLDTFARRVGLMPAWGSSVAKAAIGGRYLELPYTVKGMDFSFTGLLTRSIELAQEKRIGLKDLCYSLQETAFSMVCEATERAVLLTKSKELCVCGGVAQSDRLKEMLAIIAKEHHIKFGFAPNEFNADNGGMIAFVAEGLLKKGYKESVPNCGIEQRYRIDRAILA
ncbi:MAG: KEOPS complex N(6)-L-threonylcarbamoyladenine synthase Kae1 [Candidatus Micrarchaeia archaeon]